MGSTMPRNHWFRNTFYAWSLGLEASSVIALRTLKIAAGGVAAEAETRRMVSRPSFTGTSADRRARPHRQQRRDQTRWCTTDAKCVRTGAGWQKDEPSM